jgi:hypothetical protein
MEEAKRSARPGRSVALRNQRPRGAHDALAAAERFDRQSSPSLIERNFNFAARAVGLKCQVDRTAEFMRNQIADEA